MAALLRYFRAGCDGSPSPGMPSRSDRLWGRWDGGFRLGPLRHSGRVTQQRGTARLHGVGRHGRVAGPFHVGCRHNFDRWQLWYHPTSSLVPCNGRTARAAGWLIWARGAWNELAGRADEELRDVGSATGQARLPGLRLEAAKLLALAASPRGSSAPERKLAARGAIL